MGPPNLGLRYASIRKDAASLVTPPNLTDYDAARAQFCWETGHAKFTGLRVTNDELRSLLLQLISDLG
jgi:hypothetical protein